MTDDLSRNEDDTFVFPGTVEGKPLVGFPKYWKKVLKGTTLEGITPHVLRHSFASIANDLGFTDATVAALLGYSRGTVTSRYIHTVDTALIMAADTTAGYIDGLLEGMRFTRTSYALDHPARGPLFRVCFLRSRLTRMSKSKRLQHSQVLCSPNRLGCLRGYIPSLTGVPLIKPSPAMAQVRTAEAQLPIPIPDWSRLAPMSSKKIVGSKAVGA